MSLPLRGKFVTIDARQIDLCTRAHRAARHGGFVNLKGYPVVIRRIDFEQFPGAELKATVHFERVRDLRAASPHEMVARY